MSQNHLSRSKAGNSTSASKIVAKLAAALKAEPAEFLRRPAQRE
jgi:hypothetical protein